MSKTEAVIVGDLHLEKHSSFLPSYLDGTELTLKVLRTKVMKYCINNGIKHVIFLGDIFQHPFPKQDTVITFINFLQEYKWCNFYIIPGNHDYESVYENAFKFFSYLANNKLLPNVRIVEQKRKMIEIDNIPFCFVPHPYTKSIKTEYPKVNIGHFTVNGARLDSQMLAKDGVELKTKKDTWILGHLHTAQQYYTGTLMQLSFGETLPKGFDHYKFKLKSNKLEAKRKFVEIDPPYRLINLKITKEEDIAKIKKKDNFLYKLFIKKGVNISYDDLVNEYPNIIKQNTYKSKKDYKDLVAENFDISHNSKITTFDATHKLRPYLVSKGASPGVAFKAAAIMHSEIVKDL